jgi:hypothetical protein
VPKFELYKHNDELFSIYYGIFYVLWTFAYFDRLCKGFFNFIPLFFLFLAWRPSWFEIGITGYNFGRGPSKDHFTKVWLQLAQCFWGEDFYVNFP